MINQIDPLNQFTWWSSLKHGGLLIAPARLAHYFSTQKPELSSYWAGRLRSAVQAQQDAEKLGAQAALLDTVLEGILQLPAPESGADIPRFLQELWQTLTDELHLIVPATLTGFRDRPLPGTTNVRQIDADLLRLRASSGIWRCQACRRAHSRPTPRLTCLAWRCTGTLALETEDPDNYDLIMLDGRFDMIRPREHSAQIPGADREELERVFKGDGDRVNTLVCTPTLELGVDIGALDSVLMRNVPPLPSNYWQRAGRAGRRHRMAVILTYARAHSHDRPYFNDPLKLLSGEIAPPSFNLRNDVMVRKHVHAIVLTGLHRLSRPNSEIGNADQIEAG